MAADKTADAIKLNLRLPKPLHKRLKQQARRNNVSLNTEIVNQLEGHHEAALKDAIRVVVEPLIDSAFERATEATDVAMMRFANKMVQRFAEAQEEERKRATDSVTPPLPSSGDG
jgi:hypothetical protein